MKVDRKELANMLGIKSEGLKTIEKRHQLEERLDNIGYKLIEKEKLSRNVYYIIETINVNKELISSMCKYVFEANKSNEFIDYFIERTGKSKADVVASTGYISEKINVNTSTVRRWDLKLLDKKIISNDGFFYFKLNKENHIIEEVSKEEYNSYWKRREDLKQYDKLYNRYVKGEITFNEALRISNDATALRIELGEKYLYKTKRYKLNQNNALYIDFIKLINE